MTNKDSKVENNESKNELKVKGRKKISEMTPDEKREFMRELRMKAEINEEPTGPLASYETYRKEQLKKGRVTAVVDADKPGRIKELLDKGYRIDDSSEFTGNTASRNSVSSQIEVNLGTQSSHAGLVMSTDQDNHDLLMLKRQIEIEQIEEGLGQTGISSQVGEITIGNRSIKKK